MITLINNQAINKQDAKVDLFSEAVLFGFGLFETFRTYPDQRFFRLDDHINRLMESAGRIRLNIDYSDGQIRNMVEKVAVQSRYELQRFKILAIPGQLIITSSELILDQSIYEGVGIKPVSQQRALPEIKSTSYLDCLLSYKTAQEAGFHDALLVNDQGVITEGSRCNVFWVENGSVFTKKNQVLPGITRKAIVEDLTLNVEFKNIHLKNLLKADEVCISNSINGIVPVLKIDQTPIHNGQMGPYTKAMMQAYHNLTVN